LFAFFNCLINCLFHRRFLNWGWFIKKMFSLFQSRKRATGDDAPPAKKAKPVPAQRGSGEDDVGDGIVVDGLGTLSPAEITGWAQTGQLSGLTVAQLKSICKGLGVAVGGAKADLVSRITAACM
jgi:hypothetical protein